MMNYGSSGTDYQDYSYSGGSDISGSQANIALSPYLNIDPSYLNQGGSQFVFPTDSTKKRSWGESMMSNVGTSYISGLTLGGIWGITEGLRNPDGRTLKLRINSVLNGCTRRGPFLGNSVAVVALMYSCINTALSKARGEEDVYNSVGAAVATGVLFKSTAGIRAVGIAGVLGGSLAITYYLGEKLMESKGATFSKPNWQM